MVDYSNVLFTSVSYRRNIKDMPFVKMLTDSELAIGVSRSASEIFGDKLEFKSLKNISLNDCFILKEDGIFTDEIIDNKDISAYGISDDKLSLVFINEQDHIKVEARSFGYNLEKCYTQASELDDKILEKLEVCFNNNLGYLTSNPYLVGTGMEIKVLLFLPALVMNKKIGKIEDELFNGAYELFMVTNEKYDYKSPFVILKNKYTFGYKESEFATNMQDLVNKILELETKEENSLFDLFAGGLADNIFRAYGILSSCYKISYLEAEEKIGQMLWGIKLKMLKSKVKMNALKILSSIMEYHLGQKLSIKEQDKKRARILNTYILENIQKGVVDV